MAFKLEHHFTFWWPFRDRFARLRGESRAAVPEIYARSEFTEQFRLLALNISSLLGDSPDRSLAVFSIDPQDGRSTVATNLSLALTAHSDVVLLGNTGLSGVHKQLLEPFELADGSRALVPKSAGAENVHRLWLLPWAHSAVTRTERLNAMTRDAKQEGKFLIVDTPAAADSSDAFMLAQKCRNVLYVMRKGVLETEPHRRALEQLERLNTRVVGIVVNDN